MKKSTVVTAILLAISSMTMSAAHADVIYYFTKTGFYNGDVIADQNTFASATFKTSSTANDVTLTMKVFPGLDSGGFVSEWAFNVNSSITSLTHSFVSGTEAKKVDFGSNTVKNFGGNNGGDFDLGFLFYTSDGQLAVNGTSIYKLTGTGLTESSFSLKNNENRYSAVKVQGYDNKSSEYQSGDPTDNPLPPTSIPEPTTVALLGLGLLGFAMSRRALPKNKNI